MKNIIIGGGIASFTGIITILLQDFFAKKVRKREHLKELLDAIVEILSEVNNQRISHLQFKPDDKSELEDALQKLEKIKQLRIKLDGYSARLSILVGLSDSLTLSLAKIVNNKGDQSEQQKGTNILFKFLRATYYLISRDKIDSDGRVHLSDLNEDYENACNELDKAIESFITCAQESLYK